MKKTDVLIILPGNVGHRINYDLNISYTIAPEYLNKYQPYADALKNYNFKFQQISAKSHEDVIKIIDFATNFQTYFPTVSYVIYMDPDTYDGSYFYGHYSEIVRVALGVIESSAIPTMPINLEVEEDPFFELSIKGCYLEALETLTSIPKIFYDNGKLLFPENEDWYLESEKELYKYLKKTPNKIFDMSSRQFESFIASIFRANGAEVHLTPATRDGGYDILAVESKGTKVSKCLIECKRYQEDNKVGIGHVQRLIGVVNELKATKGILVTTSSFTKDAKKSYMATKNYMELKDFKDIVSWLTELNLMQ